MEAELREKITAWLFIDEGEKLKLYKDSVGIFTIGIGHNIQEKGISPATSRFIFNEDIDGCEKELNRSLPWWSSKPENVKLVLLNMCFNIGISRLLGFKKTLQLIKDDKFNEAAIEMLDSAWSAQVGNRAIRLSKLLQNLL
jgi:lysozyme